MNYYKKFSLLILFLSFLVVIFTNSRALAGFYVGVNGGLNQSAIVGDDGGVNIRDGLLGLNLGYELGFNDIKLGLEAFGAKIFGKEEKTSQNTRYEYSSVIGVKTKIVFNVKFNPYIVVGFARIKGDYKVKSLESSENITISSGLMGFGVSKNIGRFAIYGEIDYLIGNKKHFEINNTNNSFNVKNMLLVMLGARIYL